jgi:hypothetical protein
MLIECMLFLEILFLGYSVPLCIRKLDSLTQETTEMEMEMDFYNVSVSTRSINNISQNLRCCCVLREEGSDET